MGQCRRPPSSVCTALICSPVLFCMLYLRAHFEAAAAVAGSQVCVAQTLYASTTLI
jgi:hypothetical protein